MGSNPVPLEPAVRGADQPAEGDSTATTLTRDVTVEAHREADGDVQPAEGDSASTSLSLEATVEAQGEADGGCGPARYVPV